MPFPRALPTNQKFRTKKTTTYYQASCAGLLIQLLTAASQLFAAIPPRLIAQKALQDDGDDAYDYRIPVSDAFKTSAL